MAAPVGVAAILALSAPTLVFAGFDLARRAYLPAFLADAMGPGPAGMVMAALGVCGLGAELVAGVHGDRAPSRWRVRHFWLGIGTALIVLAGVLLLRPHLPPIALFGLLPLLLVGWIMANVTHGAWALDLAGVAACGLRLFSARALAGVVGFTGFAALLAWGDATGITAGIAPFAWLLGLTTALAIPAHMALALLVPHPPAPLRPRVASWLSPFRLLWASAAHRRLALLFALVGAQAGIDGASFLFLVSAGLGLPGWGSTAIAAKAAGAAISLIASLGRGSRLPARAVLAAVLTGHAGMAALIMALPPGNIWALLVWSLACGVASALDFTLLKVLLAALMQNSAERGGANGGARHYAAFHMPYNLMAAAAAAAVLAVYGQCDGLAGRFGMTEQSLYLRVILPCAAACVLACSAVISWRFRLQSE